MCRIHVACGAIWLLKHARLDVNTNLEWNPSHMVHCYCMKRTAQCTPAGRWRRCTTPHALDMRVLDNCPYALERA